MKRTTFKRRARFEALEPRHMMAYLAGDFDLNGVVNNSDYSVWRAEFGAEIESPADGNDDGAVDAADYILWRNNVGKTLADVPPDAPRLVNARAVGATNIEVAWQAAVNTTSYSVQRRQPDTETEFTTIASNLTLTTYTDNAAVSDTSYDYRVVAQNTHGSSGPSQIAQATANKSNLTAYQPQDIQDPNNPLAGPLYNHPFPKKAVPEQNEFSSTFGPGIRINNDPDPVVNGTPTEDDLVEVKIDRLPGQGNVVLQRSGDLVLYYDYAKTTPIPLTDGSHTVALPLVNNTISVFVEWANPEHGTDILSLEDAGTFVVLDSVRFHTFKSVVAVFGGRTQNPLDTDGDGSIGDPVRGIPFGNREGIFDLAQNLRDSGWNVLAFDSTNPNTNTVIDVAYNEIVNEITYQLIGDPITYGGGVAILGYSWGGGAAHDLIQRLWNDFDYNTTYGVYLDAIVHGGATAQTDWPNEAFYALNIYQENTFLLHGDPIDPNDVTPGATLEDIDTTTAPGFPGNLGHSSIDDNTQVQARILLRLGQLMFR